MEILYALSVAVFVVLFTTLVFIILRVRSTNEKSLRELHDAVALLRDKLDETSPRRAHVPAGDTIPAKRADPQHREALTVKIEQPLIVKVGDEVIELDAETVARIEAVTEDVTAGRIDSTLLRRLIDAGFNKVGGAKPPSGRQDTGGSGEPPSKPPKPPGR